MNRQLLEVLVSSSVLILALSAMRLVLRGKRSGFNRREPGERDELCAVAGDGAGTGADARSGAADADTGGRACRAACGSICGSGRNTGFADRRA